MPPKYDQHDPRLESLVMEHRTTWSEHFDDFSGEEKTALARRVHEDPAAAMAIEYVRSPTGFTRVIHLGEADRPRLERLRAEQAAPR